MTADLVIRGGTVFDGSGSPGRVADVTITDNVIQEIGPHLEGRVELDASGCAVAPGFIDIHTHFDAQVFWDPELKPSSYHGVTTVVAGNCGFSIAPCRPEHHDVIVHTLENVEGMDAASLSAGIVWEFETFPDYLELVRSRGTALNFTAYLGHTALRLYVMGDSAYERAATPDEIDHMCQLLSEGLALGAAGFSTSFSFAHRGVDGKPVPSRFAEMDEVEALFMTAGKSGKGVVLTTPGWQCEYADVYTWQPRVGRPFTGPLFAASNGSHLKTVKLHQEGIARGANVWPQVTPRPLTMQFTLADAYNLNVGEVFAELMKVSRPVREAAFRDPKWRALAFNDLEHGSTGMKPRWDTYEVSESKRFPELVGRRVSDIAGERGSSPLDVMCELSLAEDLTTRFRAYIANDDPDAVGLLLTEDHVILGLTDAGAHVDQLCDAPLPTDLLGQWVRERKIMPLEQAINKLTGEPADMFGFERRGYLRQGYFADVCVFDPATVGPGPQKRLRDLPANGERLTNEEPSGVRHVLVNGTLIRKDEVQLDLDELPGAHASLV
ncbi:MAG TPA: amidohydrolase family protein [Acidimicrobiales bacterium]|jgi:N-acyl-D-amino-acid deacylase|nr:amidohydrolase family protein [Acidimicrobiales bacterium]